MGSLPLRAVDLKEPKVEEMQGTENFTVLPKSCKEEILKHPLVLAVFASLLVPWPGYYEKSCLRQSQSETPTSRWQSFRENENLHKWKSNTLEHCSCLVLKGKKQLQATTFNLAQL